MMNTKNFIQALHELAKERNVEESTIIEILKEAFVKAFHKNFDPEAYLDVKININDGEIEIINHSKTVVDDDAASNESANQIKSISDEAMRAIEIPLADALIINPDIKVGETVSAPVDIKSFTITAANHIKQMVIQKMRELERENTYKKWVSFEGQIENVILERKTSRGDYILLLRDNKTIAHMKPENVNPLEKYINGQKLRVVIESVSPEATGPQIIAGRTSAELIKLAISEQVPEVYDGTVRIVNIVRKAGLRTKVAVQSNNDNVDPVGSIIGERGKRIIAISNLFAGEPIDIIRFSKDIRNYIGAALSPARVIGVAIEPAPSNKATVIVADKNYLVAIGKRGSNASMTAKLTNRSITIMKLSDAEAQNFEYQTINLDSYKKAETKKFAPFQPEIDFKKEVANAVDLEEISQDQMEANFHNNIPVQSAPPVAPVAPVAPIEKIVVSPSTKAVSDDTPVETVESTIKVLTPAPVEVETASLVEVATAKTIDNPVVKKPVSKEHKPKFQRYNKTEKALPTEDDHLTKAEKTQKVVSKIDVEANDSAIKEIEKQLNEDKFASDDYDDYYDENY